MIPSERLTKQQLSPGDRGSRDSCLSRSKPASSVAGAEAGLLFSRAGPQQSHAVLSLPLARRIPSPSGALDAQVSFHVSPGLHVRFPLALAAFSSPVCRGVLPELLFVVSCPSLDCEFCAAVSLGFNCCLQLPPDCSVPNILRGPWGLWPLGPQGFTHRGLAFTLQ